MGDYRLNTLRESGKGDRGSVLAEVVKGDNELCGCEIWGESGRNYPAHGFQE